METLLQDLNIFQSIFKTSLEGILVVDDNGIIIKANPTCEKIFGYNPGELIHQKKESIIPEKFKKHPKNHKENYKAKTKAKRIGKDLELWGLKKDGSQLPLEISLTPTKIEGKQVIIIFVIDITEQKTKDALFSIKNNALASTSNGIVIADAQNPNRPIIYCNAAFTKITGYTQKEVLNKNCNFLQNDDRHQKEIDIMKDAITHGKICHVTLRNYKKNGSLFWNEITLTPIFNKEDTLTHFIGVQNEVTTKVKQEHLKNLTRQILELIAKDSSLETIFTKVIEIAETQFKDYLASIIVLDEENKISRKLFAPNLPKEFTTNYESITNDSKKTTISNLENNVLRKNHEEVVLKDDLNAFWSFPIMSSNNTILGKFTIYSKQSRTPSNEEKEVAKDMSYLASIAIEKHNNTIRLKENKKELEDHAEKLKEKVLERTKQMMATVEKLVASNLSLEDQTQETINAEKSAIASKSLSSAIAKNFPKGFLIVFNQNFEMLLIEGETIIELELDKIIFEDTVVDHLPIFSEEQKTKLKQHILKTMAGESLSFEIMHKQKYFSVNTTPLLDKNSLISSALLVFNDITSQKKIEQDTKNALAKERELNELKSRFVSIASHEFRTPLSAIQTSAILLGKLNEVGKEQKQHKYVAQIKKNVKQLVVILNDLLSLSKLEEGKVEAKNELLDLVDFSKILIEEISITKKLEKKIILLTPDNPLLFHFDPKLMHHILLNLVSNAIKYSQENRNINIKIEESNQYISLEVQDHGIGIPEEEQHRVFERFFRAKNAQNIQGTGLGLNIVKQYVVLMNGFIDFESEINKGATFLVKWPKPSK
jgi:PAS domain S-box-containing protein